MSPQFKHTFTTIQITLSNLQRTQLQKVQDMSPKQAEEYLGARAYEAYLATGRILTNKEIDKLLS
jgi:hypothetical protein